MLLYGLVLLALVSAPALAAGPVAGQPAPQPGASPAAPGGEAPRGGCAPAFDLAAAEVTPAQQALPGAAPEPEWLAPPGLKGYCHCGCGVRCASSADCGGSPCRAFVTCC
jgi:hypothetical protein